MRRAKREVVALDEARHGDQATRAAPHRQFGRVQVERHLRLGRRRMEEEDVVLREFAREVSHLREVAALDAGDEDLEPGDLLGFRVLLGVLAFVHERATNEVGEHLAMLVVARGSDHRREAFGELLLVCGEWHCTDLVWRGVERGRTECP